MTATSDAPAVPTASTRSRGLKLLGGLRWLVARSIAILVFIAGVALGYQAFLSTQPAPPPIGDPATAGVATPAAVNEFIDALQTNDSAALRAAVPGDPYQLLITEMARWDLKSVTGVKTLSTYDDGPRSATELVITGVSTTGAPVSINLVVHLDGGKIVSFR